MTSPVKVTSTNTVTWTGKWRRRPLGWVVGAALSLALGMGLGARATPSALLARLGLQQVGTEEFGVLVLHPDDCTSAWRFLELLARPTVHARLPVVAIITTARARDRQWRDRLPRALRNAPDYTLTRKAAAALGPLGLQGVPSLLVFREQKLVGIERTPLNAVDFVELGRRLDPTLNR